MKKVLLLTLTLITLGLSSAFAQQAGNLEDIFKRYNVPMSQHFAKNNAIAASERGAILVDSTKAYSFTSLKDSAYTGKKITYRKTKKDYVTFSYQPGANKPNQKDTTYEEANKNTYYASFTEGTTGKLDKPNSEYKYYYNAKVNDFDSLIALSFDSKGIYSPWLKVYWKYNTSGKKVQDSVLFRDYTTNILVPDAMYKYAYGTNGKIATEEYYRFTDKYELVSIATYTYPNTLTQEISYATLQGQVGSKSISTYNNVDLKFENRTSYKHWRLDIATNDFNLTDSIRVKFDANKNPILEENWYSWRKSAARYARKFNNTNQVLVESYLEKADAEPDFKLKNRTYGYFSAGVSTQENRELEAKTNIYPNPTADRVFVAAPEDATATVFDLNGRILLSQQAVNQWINVANLPKGMYLMKITNKEGTSTVKKLVKE